MKPFLTTALLVLIGLTGFGQSFKNEFGFKTENDAYLATLNDRYYTNGLFIYFRRAINPAKYNNKIEKKTYEISVGQKMYTAYWGQVAKKKIKIGHLQVTCTLAVLIQFSIKMKAF